MQESVLVVGFPTGGDNVCVNKGVASRLDRYLYSHGRCSLLTVQTDAPINRWDGEKVKWVAGIGEAGCLLGLNGAQPRSYFNI